MKLSQAKRLLSEWAYNKPDIKRLYICGSRARADYQKESDLDIVVEIDPTKQDETAKAIWFHEANKWRRDLKALLHWEIDLIRYDPFSPEDTPYATNCLKEGNILVFSRTG